MEALYELRDMLCDQLAEYGERGELTNATLEKIDTLAHALKNVDKVIDCREGEADKSWNARSRSKRSYSMRSGTSKKRRMNHDEDVDREDLIDRMYSMMDDMPDEKSKEEMQKLVSRMESM